MVTFRVTNCRTEVLNDAGQRLAFVDAFYADPNEGEPAYIYLDDVSDSLSIDEARAFAVVLNSAADLIEGLETNE